MKPTSVQWNFKILMINYLGHTPLLKHGQETKKVQDMRPVLAVSMVYGDTFQKKWKFFTSPFVVNAILVFQVLYKQGWKLLKMKNGHHFLV